MRESDFLDVPAMPTTAGRSLLELCEISQQWHYLKLQRQKYSCRYLEILFMWIADRNDPRDPIPFLSAKGPMCLKIHGDFL
jgi:hypothetical protein